jgi:hypothetical protein
MEALILCLSSARAAAVSILARATASFQHVRSQEIRSRAEQMINPESRHLMSGLADDYERTAHLVEGMASIRSALTSVMASVNGLLSQQ